ncbi:HK97 gp10 family phage protein [Clostridium butyricum]|uniref:HK97 gp10 family phage protein n=1 Tax=Clostridium butyricum TaxID=1492 RepID=UPI002AB18D57|nr:HK97 gp10 family phage protein [Clostridium butyricum]
MDGGIFDIHELDIFERQLLNIAEKEMPRETKKHLKKEGRKLKSKTKGKAKSKVKKVTGSYMKGIKNGKVYKFNGSLATRVYNTSPHAHLIENGHRIVTKSGKEVGFKEGEHVFEEAAKEFENEYVKDTEQFIDEITRKL